MAACMLRKGDRIYECRYHESTLTELVTDPELRVQGDNSHYWYWKAKVIETNSRNVVPGEIIEFGITEEALAYGPKLFRKSLCYHHLIRKQMKHRKRLEMMLSL